MNKILSDNGEQFQMLLMALEDINNGICLFQSEEQSKWVTLIQEELKSKKVSTHDIADDEEEAGMPLISDFKRWAAESEADVVIVYNLQLLGLRFGDREAVEHLNFMRDQIQHIGKLFLFGVSPYFDLLLSRGARDLYSCIRYYFKFSSIVLEESKIEEKKLEERDYRRQGSLNGNYAMEIEKYREYKQRTQDRVGEEQIRLYLECMDSWQNVRGNLPIQEKDDIRKMADCVEKYYREKEPDLSEVEQLWTLADIWLELEEKEKAFYWYRQTEERIREELGTDHKLYADVLVRLADYCQMVSDYEQCEKYYDQALAIYGKEKAPLEETCQDILMKKAVLYRRKCQYDQALEIYEKLMQYYTAKYGSGYIENAVCLNNIGRVYKEQGDASGALAKYREALNILLASGEKNHLLGALYNNIAALYLDNGDTKNAWKNVKLAKRETESLYGHDSIHMILIYNLMSGVWNKKERLDKAMEYLDKAIGLIGKTHTDGTEQAAFVYYNMGNILTRVNSPLNAIPFLRRALELRLRIYGKSNVLTAASYEGLSRAFCAIADKKQCRKNMCKAKEIYTELYGADNPKVKELEQLMNAQADGQLQDRISAFH